MSYLLIDGYNLIGTVKRNMESEREELIERLYAFTCARHHRITLVFDGWKDGLPVETRTRKGNVTIIYSRLRETADAVIKRILSEGKNAWIVVSSDREIMKVAQEHGYMYLKSHEFNLKVQEVVTSPVKGNFDVFEDDYETSIQFPKKGNPHKLSKKERQKLKAMKKI
jgi:predicted RNA-binding protein with PIN domain